MPHNTFEFSLVSFCCTDTCDFRCVFFSPSSDTCIEPAFKWHAWDSHGYFKTKGDLTLSDSKDLIWNWVFALDASSLSLK